MESLLILIPIAVLFIALAVKVFFWAVDSGQFDDLEGPAHSILYEDALKKDTKADTHQDSNDDKPLQS